MTAVMNNDVRDKLLTSLGPDVLAQIFHTAEAIGALEEPSRTTVKDVFMKGYNLQLRILVGFAAAELPATALMWQKEAVRIE